jgi:hypothetical protein
MKPRGGRPKPSKTQGKPKAKTSAKPRTRAKAKPQPQPKAAHKGPAGTFDRAAYDLPLMDLGEAVALGTALLASKPARSAPAIAEEAARLATACGRARAFQKTAHAQPEEGLAAARPFDVAMDRAWATFVRRIEDHAELTAGGPAAKVYAIVHDLSILQLNFLAEFAQIGARLDSLRREGLLEDARDLAGSAFLEEVLRCHGEYGEAIGAGSRPAEDGPSADQGAARLALTSAIAEYTYQVLATARVGHPESWTAVQAALAPIAAMTAKQKRERSAPRPKAPPPAHPAVHDGAAALSR